jgi:hypothetical protein
LISLENRVDVARDRMGELPAGQHPPERSHRALARYFDLFSYGIKSKRAAKRGGGTCIGYEVLSVMVSVFLQLLVRGE